MEITSRTATRWILMGLAALVVFAPASRNIGADVLSAAPEKELSAWILAPTFDVGAPVSHQSRYIGTLPKLKDPKDVWHLDPSASAAVWMLIPCLCALLIARWLGSTLLDAKNDVAGARSPPHLQHA